MSKLFSPFTMRGLNFDNRVVLSPMCQYAARDGNAGEWHATHLGTYALSNLGLVITEATGVEPEGRISPWCLGLYSDANQQGLARIIKFFREYSDSRFGVQLAHAGRKSSVLPSFMIRKSVPVEEGGSIPICPSYYEDTIHPHPQVMDRALIERTQTAWGNLTTAGRGNRRGLVGTAFRPRLPNPSVSHAADQQAGGLVRRLAEKQDALWPGGF